jgi:CheY-like chemotaxis protein
MRDGSGLLAVDVETIRFEPDITDIYTDIQPGDYVRITVSDSGCGIPAENLGKIFEPYFTTKRIGEGTGLGLSVVHGIVKSHNGHIMVYSEPGKGTSFHVYLPLIQKTAADLPDTPVGPLPAGTERILLVDDEPSIVNMQAQHLKKLGYSVTPETSSLEALETFRQTPDQYDLIITDMTMPKMTGDKLAEEIKRIRPDIKVILCTGFSEKILANGEGLDIDFFLIKPVDNVKMATTVRSVLEASPPAYHRNRRHGP